MATSITWSDQLTCHSVYAQLPRSPAIFMLKRNHPKNSHSNGNVALGTQHTTWHGADRASIYRDVMTSRKEGKMQIAAAELCQMRWWQPYPTDANTLFTRASILQWQRRSSPTRTRLCRWTLGSLSLPFWYMCHYARVVCLWWPAEEYPKCHRLRGRVGMGVISVPSPHHLYITIIMIVIRQLIGGAQQWTTICHEHQSTATLLRRHGLHAVKQ